MTGKTHRAGGALIAVIGFWLLKENGLLLSGVNEGIQLAVLYPFTMWGSVASDLDHGKDSCPEKDGVSLLINKALHISTPIRKTMKANGVSAKNPIYRLLGIFDAEHRSWQTHSDFTLFLLIAVLWAVLSGSISPTLTLTDTALLSLMMVGICLGMVAHLVLDMLTPQGIWLALFAAINRIISLITRKDVEYLPEKLHLVPNAKFFATGGVWETVICKVLEITTWISVVYLLFITFPGIGQMFGL